MADKRSSKPSPPPTPSGRDPRGGLQLGTGRAGGRQASTRGLLIGGGALLAVIVAIVAVLALRDDGDGGVAANTSRGTALPYASETIAALAGITQSGNVLGNADAPVTMVEYVDLQCPVCRTFETEAMPSILEQYVKTGKLRIETRPIAFIGDDSERGRALVLAAARQNQMFGVMQLLYLNQGAENSGWLDEATVRAAASSFPGIDIGRLLTDREGDAVAAQAKEFETDASADGVTGTPTVLVGKTGGALTPVSFSSYSDPAAVSAAIDAAIG